ncbi:MAG: choice-of-anchor D domain-containing protein [bacterium]
MHDTLPLLLNPNTNNTMTLNFDPAEVGTSGATIKIRSNDPFQPEVDIPVNATAKDAQNDPCIQVNPTSLNYGGVQRGQSVAKTFVIQNCGSRTLNVSTIERGRFFGIPTSVAYQITSPWTSGAIPAGGSQIVEITYAPRRAGLDSGFFLVRNDDPSNSAARVNVSGTSEAPPIADQDIHVEVEWDSNDTDVDTHMLLLPGQGLFCDNDCYFSNPEPDWGVQGDWLDDPFLDRDDVDGYGPENINIAKGINNQTYRVVLHYWRDSYNNSFSSASNVTVKLYIRGALIQTWGPIYLGSTGDTKNVFEIDWPSQTIRGFNDPLYSVPSSTSCRATP